VRSGGVTLLVFARFGGGRAPYWNVYAERFVESVKEECLDRVVPLGERHLRHTLREFATYYTLSRTVGGILSCHHTSAT
jgi:hypothetical protein